MKILALFLLMFFNIGMYSQGTSPLSVFDNLVGRTWVAEGTWGDGSAFKQEITFKYDLNKSIVTSESDGFVDDKQSVWGHRNHGVRQWDATSKQIKFWEYDVFGGVTTGNVLAIDKGIYYQYEYGEGEGRTTVTDGWEKINENKYKFTVGVFQDGEWKTTYLTSTFEALPIFTGDRDELNQILSKIKVFSATYMSGDHNLLATYYTQDGKIMPGGSKIIEGREAIAQRWKLSEGSSILNHEVHPEKIEIDGNTAIDYGYYQGKSQAADGKQYPFRGKYVIIWKKVDDNWLIDVDIWNSIDNG